MKTNHSFFGATRAARTVALSGVCLLLLFVLLTAANAATKALPNSIAKPDLTGTETFLVSDTSLDFLKELDQDVTLYLLCNGGLHMADDDLYAFFARYAEASPHVTLKVIDTSTDTEFLAAHGGAAPSDMSLIVESAARYKIIDNLDLYYYFFYDPSAGSLTLTALEYLSMLDNFSQSDPSGETLAYLTSNTTPYFNGESCVTNAIKYVTLDRVASVYLLKGNTAVSFDAALTDYLSDASFDLFEIASLAELPDTCDALVIHSVQADLVAEEAAKLSEYLAGGGKLFLTTSFDKTAFPNLAAVLKTYGLGMPEASAIVCEGHTNYRLSSTLASYAHLFYAHMNANHPISNDLGGSFVAFGAHPITLTETEGVTLTPWLLTSTVGFLMDPATGKQTEAPKAAYTIGAIAQKGNTQIVWLSSAASLVAEVNDYSANENFDLVLQVLNHLSGVQSETIAISARVMDVSALSVSNAQLVVLGIFLVVALPLTFAGLGIGIRYTRKKR